MVVAGWHAKAEEVAARAKAEGVKLASNQMASLKDLEFDEAQGVDELTPQDNSELEDLTVDSAPQAVGCAAVEESADMSSADASTLRGVLENDAGWQALRALLDADRSADEAHSHAHVAQEAAARQLITNHEAVLRDLTNPSQTKNIVGNALTQLELRRVAVASAAHADEALREVARRLLSHRPGSEKDDFNSRFDPRQPQQPEVWAQSMAYLDGRLQALAKDKPGRRPDMSADAAAAMRAVLKEVREMAATAAVPGAVGCAAVGESADISSADANVLIDKVQPEDATLLGPVASGSSFTVRLCSCNELIVTCAHTPLFE